MPKTGQEVKLRLYDDPELCARQLYEFLRTQSLEVRKNIQSYIDDLPLTKESLGKFSLDNLRDLGD
jgi:hypothetical protein